MSRNENQTRIELINPALYERGWTDNLIREEKTPGGVDIIDGKPRKRKGRTDYLLCIPVKEGKPPLAIAIIEAKAESIDPTHGIQQAITYKNRFNVPFAFTTNGHLFAEYSDDKQEITDAISLTEFPTPQELKHRYEALMQFKLESEEAKALLEQYKGGEAARFYFQDAAIRATLERIAKGHKRVLLSLATGTGKTVLATQLLHKLKQAGHLRKVLFVCDRDELRTQAWGKLYGIFGDDVRRVTTSEPQPNAKILVATYQTLNATDEFRSPAFWKENYSPNYFSHIIIDECHRSAWGNWSVILTDNPDAVQIGLTATPRIVIGGRDDDEGKKQDEKITANNIAYFGEPVYEYSIGLGQSDGYLAACEVIRRTVDLDKTEITRDDIVKHSGIDPYTGKKVEPGEIEDQYTAHQYERKLMLDDRVNAMCEDLFAHFLDTSNPHQKTIIFCASDKHATQIMVKMNNLYMEWCSRTNNKPKEQYAFQCTSSVRAPTAKDLIPDFKGSKNSHFIATTVELLSTGVDIPNLNNVVFFKYIESPISFYQMVGRGTRIGEPRGSKLMFRLYDFTNATRLFGEPFISRETPSRTEGDNDGDGDDNPRSPRSKTIKIRQNEYKVQIENEGCSILVEENGQDVLIPVEEYKQRLAIQLIEQAPTLEELRNIWVTPAKRVQLLGSFPGGEGAVMLIREIEDEIDCDLYDVLASIGFNMPPKSRMERVAAFIYKNKQWFKEFSEQTAEVLKAIAKQFEKGGIDELETQYIFDDEEIQRKGGIKALIDQNLRPEVLIEETKHRLLA